MHVFRWIHRTRSIYFLVGFDGFLDEAAHLLLIVCMPLDRLEDDTMRGAAALFGECVNPGAELGWQADGSCFDHNETLP